MIGNPIHFNNELIRYHQESFGRIKRANHEIKLPSHNHSEIDLALERLDSFVRRLLFYSQENLAQIQKETLVLAVASKNPNLFYEGMIDLYDTTINECLQLSKALRKAPIENPNLNTGYIYLLLSCLYYNQAIYSTKFQYKHESSAAKFELCLNWAGYFENNWLPYLETKQQIQYRPFHNILFKHITEAISLTTPFEERTSLKTLSQALAQRRNPTTVVRSSNNFIFALPEDIFLPIIEGIRKAYEHPTLRRQLIVYMNNDLGPIDVLDILYSPVKDTFEIISVSASPYDYQYHFLANIKLRLKNIFPHSNLKIAACHADCLKQPQYMPEYAYVLSRQVARATFTKLTHKSFRIKQPEFKQPFIFELSQLEDISISWFSFTALGDEAFLLLGKPQAIFALFHKTYPSDAQKRIDFYSRKYNIMYNELYVNCFPNFPEYVNAKLSMLNGPQLSLLELTAKINDDTPIQDIVDATRELNALKLEYESKTIRKKETTAMVELKKPQVNKAKSQKHKTNPQAQKLQTDKRTADFDKKEPKDKTEDSVNQLTLQFTTLDLSGIRLREQNFFLKDCAKALRRAASGYCTSHEFKQLLKYICAFTDKEKLQVLNGFDEGKKYTPLHAAFRFDKPGRALALMECGADKTVSNAEGLSPMDLYDQAPEHSRIKRDSRL